MLSVSACPDDWKRIAKLGGLHTTRLTGADASPMRFVDMLSIDDGTSRHLMHCAFVSGLVRQMRQWKAWHSDEEGNLLFSWHNTRDEAETESGIPDDMPPTCHTVLIAAPELAYAFAGQETLSPALTLDAVVCITAEPDSSLDGLYWDETLDVSALSAPRGGIFQSRLPRLIQD